MSAYNDSDSDISSSDEDIDEHQIQLEFDKQANEEYLFKKASTNESVTSVGTKPYSIIASDTDDDINPLPRNRSRRIGLLVCLLH